MGGSGWNVFIFRRRLEAMVSLIALKGHEAQITEATPMITWC